MAHNAKRQELILDNVSAGYHKKIIVGDIPFSVPTGKMTVLIEANGCGRLTLFSTITRTLQPMGGPILLDGKTTHEQPTKALSRRPGTLPQSPLLPEGLTIYEPVSCGHFSWQDFIRQRSDADEQAVEDALKLTGTQKFAHLPAEKLSGGQRQRCRTAMVLARKTPYILLDEPTTRLDLYCQVEILELLHGLARHHGRTIVVVLHDLNFAINYDDALIFLRQGKVVRVLNEGEHCAPELAKAVFDVDVHASINPLMGKSFLMPFRGVEKV